MKRFFVILLVLGLAIGISGCGGGASQTPSMAPPAVSSNPSLPDAEQGVSSSSAAPAELTIAAAASLTVPLNEIIANYAVIAPNVKITVNYGASGALQTQIENGAPIDIFFPAATKQMDTLDSKGLIEADSIVKLLKNEIVLIVPTDSKLTLSKFEDAGSDIVVKVALGDVASVPAGQYAQEAFTSLNLWDKVSTKAVFGSDVKQVLSWVDAGDVDCGVVYQTDAVSDSNVTIVAAAPSDSHKAVVYPVAVVKASTQQAAAVSFISYLQSTCGIDVFTNYGFLAY